MLSVCLIFQPCTQEGVLVNENSVPSTQMTVLSPIKENPGLHLRDTSLPGGIGNCVSVSISFHPNGKLLQLSAG